MQEPTRPILIGVSTRQPRPALGRQLVLVLAGLSLAMTAVPWAFGATSSGSNASPQAVVRQTTTRLFHALEQPGTTKSAAVPASSAVVALVDRIVSPHVDYQAVARRALGSHWKSMSPEQRKRFTKQFHELLVHTYSTVVTSYTHARIQYAGVKRDVQDRAAVVRTVVAAKGADPVHVDYRMIREHGDWMLLDVDIGGASLLTTYRRSFADLIAKKGISGLLQALAKKNQALTASRGD